MRQILKRLRGTLQISSVEHKVDSQRAGTAVKISILTKLRNIGDGKFIPNQYAEESELLEQLDDFELRQRG